jgi:hypothetical protein
MRAKTRQILEGFLIAHDLLNEKPSRAIPCLIVTDEDEPDRFFD